MVEEPACPPSLHKALAVLVEGAEEEDGAGEAEDAEETSASLEPTSQKSYRERKSTMGTIAVRTSPI